MHPFLSDPIHFQENQIQILVLEQPKLFRTLVFELIQQSKGEDGRFVVSKNYQLLEGASCLHIVTDYSYLQPDDRKIIGRFQSAVQSVTQTVLWNETAELMTAVRQYIDKLSNELDCPIEYDEQSKITSILKAVGIRLAIEDDNPIESLIDHITAYVELLPNQCIILVGAKIYFEDDELVELYKISKYKRWNLLLIEPYASREKLDSEKYYIIDGCLCEIY